MIRYSLNLEFPETAQQVEGYLHENPDEPWVLKDVPGSALKLEGYFGSREAAHDSLDRMKEAVPHLGQPEEKTLTDEDWKLSYRNHLRLRKFGKLVWVPLWEKASTFLEPGEVPVYMDSGMAFGTGCHETTRLCAKKLVAYADSHPIREKTVLDAGCGSGILALSAAALGFGAIRGFDCDGTAVNVSRENAAMNGMDEKVNFFQADLVRGVEGPSVDVLLANIETPVLRDGAMDLLRAVTPGGWLVMSGILGRERIELENHFLRAVRLQWPDGATLESEEEGEWAGITLIRQ